MNDLVAERFVQAFQVWDLELFHRFDRQPQRVIRVTVLSFQRLSRRPQRSKNLRPVEPLSFTVLAEAHVVMVLQAATRFLTGREGA